MVSYKSQLLCPSGGPRCACLAKKYLFWSLIFLRIPATATLLNPALQFMPDSLQLQPCYFVLAFFDALLDIPGITCQTFPSSLKPTSISVSIAWWIALVKGVPPTHPNGRIDPDPKANYADLGTAVFFKLLMLDTERFAASIASGSVCSPQAFVQHTIGHMRALSNISALLDCALPFGMLKTEV
jgi:hypothetical protein